jgi:hypothetical protein
MNTEHLINYNYATLQEFYSQGIITQAQWEAFDFAWANSHVTSFPYFWGSLLPDARTEFWKLYAVLPAKLQKALHPMTCK